MRIQFLGAARTVTGSRHLVETTGGTRVLLDCGMFQGHRMESNERNSNLGVDGPSVSAVVLSHAHIDHSGALPILVKGGYRGPIYATPATRDLCASMLMDAAFIQAADARYINHRIERDHAPMTPVTPLFSQEDVVQALRQFVGIPYHREMRIADDVRITFFDAGHVLGSAVTALDIRDRGGSKRLVYTGDLGRCGLPILRDPEPVSSANVLITESTYGDRLHPAYGDMEGDLCNILRRVHARGGRVLIPAFALERAQELLFAMRRLADRGELPHIPIFVDSPLTTRITDVFKLHPECFDDDMRALVHSDHSPFDWGSVHYVASVAESMELDANDQPAVIIAASGMCEGGRVVHHLRQMVEDERNCILIVGFQAEHTLGRRIVERRPRLRNFGVERELRAEVQVLEGFSAHADQRELLEYAESVRRRGSLSDVILVHGERPSQEALASKLACTGFAKVHIPARGDALDL